MKYFMVTAKCGHVGKNNYYKGTLFLKANNGKEAARLARDCPRVKHDQKDAILSVTEINSIIFDAGRELNHKIHYYTCETVQEQRLYLSEIADNIFIEESVLEEPVRRTKRHSLRASFNMDPAYESYKNRKDIDYYAA